MRIDYLAATFHHDGPKLNGRSLVRHLRQEHDVRLLGALVEPDSKLLDGPNAEHCLVETELGAGSTGGTAPDVLFFEGGWIEPFGFARARVDVLEAYARAGGVVVVADLDRNAADRDRDALDRARGPWPAPRYRRGVRYLHDQGAIEMGNAQRFFTSQMRVAEWLEPALRGIDSLLVWGAVELDAADGIAASGHPTTKILERDLFTDEGFPWPWASVKEQGKGFIAVIGAHITADIYVNACPDNARWISNLLALLVDRAHENKTWAFGGPNAATGAETTSTLTEPDPANPNLGGLLEVEESEDHERKGSFLTPLENPDTPPIEIQLAVLKAIASLANADGGHLVIGQHNKGSVLGLADDFTRLGARFQDRDGFALRLTEFVDQRLSRSWLNMGCRLEWIDVDGKDVAIVTVPRAVSPVWANLAPGKGGKLDKMVVRSGPRTRTLEGPELGEWLANRK